MVGNSRVIRVVHEGVPEIRDVCFVPLFDPYVGYWYTLQSTEVI